MKLTIATWVRKNIFYSFKLLALFLVFSQFLIVYMSWQNANQQQKKLIKQFHDVAASAPVYNKVEMLNLLGVYLINEGQGGQIFFCTDENNVAWSYPLSASNCKPSKLFGYKISEAKIFSGKNFPKLIFVLPYFSHPKVILFSFLICVSAFLLTYYLISRLKKKIFTEFLCQLSGLGKTPTPQYDISEFQCIHDELIKLRQIEHDEAKADIAVQLAHDIKSPLAVLKQIVLRKQEDPVLASQAVERIQTIAQDLLKDVRSPNIGSFQGKDFNFLNLAVKNILNEKEIVIKKVKILLHGCDGLDSVLSQDVQVSNLQRVVSNLIDNAVDALSRASTGQIEITLKKVKSHFAKIQISDNGPGIPDDILPQLCQKGATFGKEDGNGLGLYHAKKTVEAWGGEFSIESTVGRGTTVSFTVPTVAPPFWFAQDLRVSPQSEIVIVDDDASIHALWQKRFAKISLFVQNSINFTNPTDFKAWIESHAASVNRIYLFDHDLGECGENGLDLIEKYDLGKQSLLVTGRADNTDIQNRVAALGTKLLPKERIAELLIRFENQCETQKTVLIDDDDLIRDFWQKKARDKKVFLDCFSTYEDFRVKSQDYSKDTQIYMDSHLKEKKGEECARELFTLGFQKIILTTGYDPSKFQNMPWIAQVVGKAPPW